MNRTLRSAIAAFGARATAKLANPGTTAAVPAAINAAVGRLIGFEIQLGPFAVARRAAAPTRRGRPRCSTTRRRRESPSAA